MSELEIAYKVKMTIGAKITGSTSAIKILRDIFPKSMNYREHFFTVYLDKANNPIGWQHVSSGGVSGTVSDIKVIMAGALLSGASHMILAHNHPSGNINASQADQTVTKRIKQAAEYMDIKLLDHIILTDSEYNSFADNGDIDVL